MSARSENELAINASANVCHLAPICHLPFSICHFICSVIVNSIKPSGHFVRRLSINSGAVAGPTPGPIHARSTFQFTSLKSNRDHPVEQRRARDRRSNQRPNEYWGNGKLGRSRNNSATTRIGCHSYVCSLRDLQRTKRPAGR